MRISSPSTSAAFTSHLGQRSLRLIVVASGLMAGLCGLTGCEEPAPEPEPLVFADTPLAGTINGEAWSFTSGATDAFLSDEDGFFTTFFGSDEADVCTAFGTGPKVLTDLPTEVGEFKLGLFRTTLTFAFDDDEGSQNDVATKGAVRIDEIDENAGTISGALQATFEEHEVDGTFTVSICE